MHDECFYIVMVLGGEEHKRQARLLVLIVIWEEPYWVCRLGLWVVMKLCSDDCALHSRNAKAIMTNHVCRSHWSARRAIISIDTPCETGGCNQYRMWKVDGRLWCCAAPQPYWCSNRSPGWHRSFSGAAPGGPILANAM